MWKPQGIYADYVLHQPTIFTGENAVNGLISVPGVKVSVIHGDSIEDSLKDSIKRVFKKRALYFIKRSWKGEPDLESLSETIAELEKQRPDLIIAVGGGSVIDGSKLCRLFYEFPSYEIGKTRINQILLTTIFVAIPTTIGSGAEISSAAVYIDNTLSKKEMVISHDFIPDAIVLDSNIVKNTPYRLMVASSLDAMAHIVEGYISNRQNNICEVMAETGFDILVHELEKDDKFDYQKLQYAGYLGGIVQNHCIVGAAHGIAHQVSCEGFSHSEAVALLLVAVIKTNSQDMSISEKYDKIINKSLLGNREGFYDLIEKLLVKSGIYAKREQLKSILVAKVANEVFVNQVIDDKGAKGNPISIDREYIMKVIGEL